MAIPFSYNVRSLRQRPVSTFATAFGMAMVVAVFIAMMALATGFQSALSETGSSENVLVLRKGADGELSSGVSRETSSSIAAMPFVAAGADGRPMVSPEVYVVLSLPRTGFGVANVVARGVSPQAFTVRKNVKIVAGRAPEPGRREVVIGKTIVKRFSNCNVGDTIEFAGQPWAVVGHFTAGGSSFESEIWGENEQFMPAFRGEVFQSVTFRMRDAESFDAIKKSLDDDPRLQITAHRETDFYAKQSVMLASVLRALGIFVTAVMSIGAVFGAVNTMYAAVASRAPEIAVLKTFGFRPGSVLTSFMIESVLLALIGGVLGCLIALPINGIVTSTTNWSTFSEVAFSFRVTPGILMAGMIFALLMGLIGGFFPARRAANQHVITALREG